MGPPAAGPGSARRAGRGERWSMRTTSTAPQRSRAGAGRGSHGPLWAFPSCLFRPAFCPPSRPRPEAQAGRLKLGRPQAVEFPERRRELRRGRRAKRGSRRPG